MPQMSPMWWVLLETYFLANLMFCHSCFYWMFIVKSKKASSKEGLMKESNKVYLYDM
uniref:ATP synthase F0 subunit 8 n=1 Tax=Haematopinus asini TaxID=1461129 RepID=A0A059T425_9NEOP|nr:ATP synthase F0 subunit 8 [Haematopinus asini]AHY04290.1 ATP synthase F0 subunit 8 [Haematopinus asini]